MILLSRLNLSVRLMLLMGLAALALAVAVAMGVTMMSQRMVADRIDKLQALVLTARGFAEALERQVQAGRLTRDQAIA